MKKTIPVKKNDYIEVVFEDLTHDGAGVAKVDGYPIFVANALPGEKANVKVTKTNNGYGFGRLMEILEKSPERVDVSVEDRNKYGGCQIQHLSYEGQLKFKEKQVREVMTRIGKLEDVTIHPIIGMEEPTLIETKPKYQLGKKTVSLLPASLNRVATILLRRKKVLFSILRLMKPYKL